MNKERTKLSNENGETEFNNQPIESISIKNVISGECYDK